MAKIGYNDSIEFIKNQVGVSFHQARLTLKEISTQLQHNFKRGMDLELDGLFNIRYQITGQQIYNNPVYDFTQLKQDVVKELSQYNQNQTELIIDTWHKYLVDSVERGFDVFVKGVASLTVQEEDGIVTLQGKRSPQLKKPEVSDFLILEGSDIEIQEVRSKDMRVVFSLSDTIRVPRRKRQSGSVIKYEADI